MPSQRLQNMQVIFGYDLIYIMCVLDCREVRAGLPSDTITRRGWDMMTSICRRESWTSSSSKRWRVLGYPSTAMPLDLYGRRQELFTSKPCVQCHEQCSGTVALSTATCKAVQRLYTARCQNVNLGLSPDYRQICFGLPTSQIFLKHSTELQV